MLGTIQRLIISEDALQTSTAQRLGMWARGRNIPVTVEPPAGGEAERSPAGRTPADFGIGPSKRSLRIINHSGATLKRCTGRTDTLLCCNLQVITQTVGCPLDCSYCVLQDYQNRAEIVIQADPRQVLEDVSRQIMAQPRRLLRVCTGQVADSLALEPEVGCAEEAVRFFSGLSNAVLELKTKTDQVELLLSLPHRGRTVVSWSLNTADVIQDEEHGTATLDQRLSAAARVARAGYLVAFHLDPMIALGRDEHRYLALIDQAFEAVPPQRIAYISLGTVRFLPTMRRTIAARFSRSRVTHGELLPSVDGKLRLLPPLRISLYRAVAGEIRRRCPEIFVYLCMEPQRIWRHALGLSLSSRVEVEHAMAESLHRRFGLAPCYPRLEDYIE